MQLTVFCPDDNFDVVRNCAVPSESKALRGISPKYVGRRVVSSETMVEILCHSCSVRKCQLSMLSLSTLKFNLLFVTFLFSLLMQMLAVIKQKQMQPL